VSYVIAVAAPPGGGKTALVRALAARLGDATAIHFDAYEMATERPVAEIVQDLRAGVAFDDFANPQLAIDLAALKNGEAITPPDEGRIEPAKYILFEMPMGRAHGPTAGLIDLLLWIDIPFDIALARKLRGWSQLIDATLYLKRQDGVYEYGSKVSTRFYDCGAEQGFVGALIPQFAVEALDKGIRALFSKRGGGCVPTPPTSDASRQMQIPVYEIVVIVPPI